MTSRGKNFFKLSSIALLAMLALSWPAPVRAASALLAYTQFEEANQAFKNQDYQQALTLYEGLAEQGIADPTLFYNMGCALAQIGAHGRSAAMFERVLRFRPRFSEARLNLQHVSPQAMGGQTFFLFIPLSELYRSLTADEFFLIATAAYWLVSLAALGWLLWRPGRLRSLAIWAGAISLAAFLFFGGFFLAKSSADSQIHAVVIADNTLAHNGPAETFLELSQLSEGVKVRCLELKDGWFKVEPPDGQPAWVPKESLEVIWPMNL